MEDLYHYSNGNVGGTSNKNHQISYSNIEMATDEDAIERKNVSLLC